MPRALRAVPVHKAEHVSVNVLHGSEWRLCRMVGESGLCVLPEVESSEVELNVGCKRRPKRPPFKRRHWSHSLREQKYGQLLVETKFNKLENHV